MYAARGVQPHERFCEAKWRPYRPTSGQEHFLDAPTDGAPKYALQEIAARFLLLFFKKARSGAPSGILEQGGGTQCRKERHGAAFLSPRESPRGCGGREKARWWGWQDLKI